MRRFKTKYNQVDSVVITNTNLLETIAKEKKHTFISIETSTIKEVSNAVKIFRKYKCSFELMYSHGFFPMKLDEANLRLIPVLRKKFKCNIGYIGYEKVAYLASVIAVTLGVTSIERHITLDRTFFGHDHAASLEPVGLQKMVRDVRLVEKILGDGEKVIWDSEIPAMKKLRQIFT